MPLGDETGREQGRAPPLGLSGGDPLVARGLRPVARNRSFPFGFASLRLSSETGLGQGAGGPRSRSTAPVPIWRLARILATPLVPIAASL